MSVDLEHARRIATLARLRFEEEELARITEELNHILDHVEALRSVEASAPADEPAPEEGATRGPGADTPDELGRGPGSVAPDWREGFFVVPPLPGLHGGGDA